MSASRPATPTQRRSRLAALAALLPFATALPGLDYVGYDLQFELSDQGINVPDLLGIDENDVEYSEVQMTSSGWFALSGFEEADITNDLIIRRSPSGVWTVIQNVPDVGDLVGAQEDEELYDLVMNDSGTIVVTYHQQVEPNPPRSYTWTGSAWQAVTIGGLPLAIWSSEWSGSRFAGMKLPSSTNINAGPSQAVEIAGNLTTLTDHTARIPGTLPIKLLDHVAGGYLYGSVYDLNTDVATPHYGLATNTLSVINMPTPASNFVPDGDDDTRPLLSANGGAAFYWYGTHPTNGRDRTESYRVLSPGAAASRITVPDFDDGYTIYEVETRAMTDDGTLVGGAIGWQGNDERARPFIVPPGNTVAEIVEFVGGNSFDWAGRIEGISSDGTLNIGGWHAFAIPVPVVSMAIDNASMAENGPTRTLTVSRSGPKLLPLTVPLELPTRLQASSPTVTIPIGASSATVTISVIDDTILNNNATVSLSSQPPDEGNATEYFIEHGSNGSLNIAITSDDVGVQPVITGPAVSNDDPTTLAIVFSEAVTGFALEDLVVGNGTASALSGSGASYTASIAPTGEGLVTVNIPANAATGSSASVAATPFGFTYDTTAPTAPTVLLDAGSDQGHSGSDRITNDSTPLIFGSAEAGSAIAVQVDGSAAGATTANSSGEWSLTLATLADGVRNVTATATDAAGNVSSASATLAITIDTVLATPTAQLDAASDTGISSGDRITNDTTPTFSGMTEAGAHVSTNATSTAGNLNGGTTADGAGAFTWTPTALAAGAWTFTALVTDVAGNTAQTTVSFTIDTTAPTLASAQDGGVTPVAPSFTVTSSEALHGFAAAASLDSGSSTVTGADGATSFTVTADAVPGAAGPVTLSIAGTPTDTAGNAISATSFSTYYDNAPIGLSISPVTDVPTAADSTEVTFTFTTAVDAGSFTADDITVSNGTLGPLATTDDTVFTATVTHVANGSVIVSVPALAATAGGHRSIASSVQVTHVDRSGPVLTPSMVTLTGTVPAGATSITLGATAATIVDSTWTVTIPAPSVPTDYTLSASDGGSRTSSVTVTIDPLTLLPGDAQ